ncbi:NAD(P)/FAD-dependent oxidoreductase [Microtetraspora fusca]|uniref:NAD(P)/FAD-dependent oxidoreductase n=1 Tax=Microtetraspora fusca TaxID=1997 RepID=A0ABW6VB28_MICFU
MGIREVAIIGAGTAGVAAAMALREGGFEGTINLLSAEKGLPYRLPPLSKTVLAGTSGPEPLRPADHYRDQDICLHPEARVSAIEPATLRITSAAGTFAPDAVVIATGSSPYRPDWTGMELDGVHVLRTLVDAEALRAELTRAAELVVIGGGFVGTEVASVASRLGIGVTIVEAGPALLGRAIGPAAGGWIGRLHAAHGVRVLTGRTVTGLRGRNRVEAVTLADGTELRADTVLVGLGAVPRTRLAARLGVGGPAGIEVDGAFRTAHPGVYAVGDVAVASAGPGGQRIRLEHERTAEQHGVAVAGALLGHPPAPASVPWFWSDQHGVTLQLAGLPGGELETMVEDTDDGRLLVTWHTGGLVRAVLGVNRPREVQAAMREMRSGRYPRLPARCGNQIPEHDQRSSDRPGP